MVEMKIALRYIFSKKTHNAVNVISLISVAGVAVATMAIVIVLSVFNGFERLAEQQISVLSPSLKVVPTSGKIIPHADSLASEIGRVSPSLEVVPLLTEQGLAIVGNRQMPVELRGVDERWMSATGFAETIIDGRSCLEDSVWRYGQLSVGAAVALKAYPGEFETLDIYVPVRKGRINSAMLASAFMSDTLLISSVFQTGHVATDQNAVIVPIESLKRMLDYSHEATEIGVWAGDNDNVERLVEKIEALSPGNIKALTIAEQEDYTFSVISVEKWITFLMLAFILLIASFNIISTLSLLVIEKQGNLNIMRAMGASKNMITKIFSIEGWLISLGGGVIGIILGVVLTLAQQWGGFIKLGGNPNQMVIDVYPVELRISDLLIVIVIVAAIGLLASVLTTMFARRKTVD